MMTLLMMHTHMTLATGGKRLEDSPTVAWEKKISRENYIRAVANVYISGRN